MVLSNCKSVFTFQSNARYAFTLEGELKKSVEFKDDEKIARKGRVRLYGKSFFSRPCYLIVTNKRVILLKHYFFRPDIVVSVGLEDISDVVETSANLFNLMFPFRRFRYVALKYCGSMNLNFYSSRRELMHWVPSDNRTHRWFNSIQKRLKSY